MSAYTHTRQDLAGKATELLQKFPPKAPDGIIEFEGRVRRLLEEATRAASWNDEELERFALEVDWALVASRFAAAVAPQTVRQCLNDCEFSHSQCSRSCEPGDRLCRFECNLDALGCTVACARGVFD
jgi:hypothetical protein